MRTIFDSVFELRNDACGHTNPHVLTTYTKGSRVRNDLVHSSLCHNIGPTALFHRRGGFKETPCACMYVALSSWKPNDHPQHTWFCHQRRERTNMPQGRWTEALMKTPPPNKPAAFKPPPPPSWQRQGTERWQGKGPFRAFGDGNMGGCVTLVGCTSTDADNGNKCSCTSQFGHVGLKQLRKEPSNQGVLLDDAQVIWMAQKNKSFEVFPSGNNEEIWPRTTHTIRPG